MEDKIRAVVAAVVVLGLGVICICLNTVSDNKGPVIRIDESKELTFQEGEDESILLQGVTATDTRDGDVTDSVRVDTIIVDGDVIKVKYAAKDSKNNITISEKYREIKYISLGIEEDIVDEQDDLEENVPENGENNSSEGVTDIVVEEIDKEAANKSGMPVILLTQKEVTINKGETFSDMAALAYVKETYDNSGDVSRRIRISGNEQELTEGDYEISFTVSDIDGNVSEPAILILHVKAAE